MRIEGKMKHVPMRAAGLAALIVLTAPLGAVRADDQLCVECFELRVGPPIVVRGPFPDELDAPFAALRLKDGSYRGFSANGSTYAIESDSLLDMGGPRREVLQAGEPGEESECGRWLTSVARSGEELLGLVHQESICDYGPMGQTDKTMAIAISSDDGLTWTDLGTVITGPDAPQPGTTSGEGDCTMIDGTDGYLYAYCLRTSDWQTIVARANPGAPTEWHKFYDGRWDEPGLDGQATAIGFLGPGAGYLRAHGAVATLTNDPWFGGLRLSLSQDKTTFFDIEEPLIPVDGSDWDRPAATDLIAYITVLNPEDGSNIVDDDFLLSYVYVPPGEGFESRYLVHHKVTVSFQDEPLATQAGLALTRWIEPELGTYITSTGPLTGDRQTYQRDDIVAYVLTSAPEGMDSIKLAECSLDRSGNLDHMLAEDGICADAGYARERVAGWLYAEAQPDTVPVYLCVNAQTQSHFASSAIDCEERGTMQSRLGHGLAP